MTETSPPDCDTQPVTNTFQDCDSPQPELDKLSRHRIAVANIATSWVIEETGERLMLVIQNDSASKRHRIEFGAVGGCALITSTGMALVNSKLMPVTDFTNKHLPATFEPHENGVENDARITVAAEDSDTLAFGRISVLKAILSWAENKDSRLLECDLWRELVEELVEDAPPILTLEEVGELESTLIGWKAGAQRQSTRGLKGVWTTPLYLCHEVKLPKRTLDKLLSDPLGRIRVVSDAEIATTKGGTREGVCSGPGNFPLFANVFPRELVKRFRA